MGPWWRRPSLGSLAQIGFCFVVAKSSTWRRLLASRLVQAFVPSALLPFLIATQRPHLLQARQSWAARVQGASTSKSPTTPPPHAWHAVASWCSDPALSPMNVLQARVASRAFDSRHSSRRPCLGGASGYVGTELASGFFCQPGLPWCAPTQQLARATPPQQPRGRDFADPGALNASKRASTCSRQPTGNTCCRLDRACLRTTSRSPSWLRAVGSRHVRIISFYSFALFPGDHR